MYHSDNNYYSDHRVRALGGPLYKHVDDRRMVATVSIEYESDDGDWIEEDVDLPIAYEVCPTCNGRGRHANPSVDCDGLTANDFAEDPDFMEDYLGGMYDVTCYGCHGRTTVPVIDAGRIGPDDHGKYLAWQEWCRLKSQMQRDDDHARRMGY